MCLLVVCINAHPSYPFICAHNRDEQRDRLARDDSLESETGILCSRDAQAGGMVLGYNIFSGNFAALTNVRSTIRWPEDVRTSRGTLVEHVVANGVVGCTQFLSNNSVEAFQIVAGSICGQTPSLSHIWWAPSPDEEDAALWADPRQVPLHAGSQDLKRGVFVISNENPGIGLQWPKCGWVQKQVEALLQTLPAEASLHLLHEGLEHIMSQSDIPDLDMPTRLPHCFPVERELLLHTGPFCPWREQLPGFGTVSQRVLVSDAVGEELYYYHRSTNVHDSSGRPTLGSWGRHCIPWPAPLPVSAVRGSPMEMHRTLRHARL